MARADTETAVKILNKIFQLDPKAIQNVIDHRVLSSITSEVEDDTDLILGVGENGDYTIGQLGIINALVKGVIAARYDESGNLLGFEVFKDQK